MTLFQKNIFYNLAALLFVAGLGIFVYLSLSPAECCAAPVTTTIFLTSGDTWVVPSDWNSANNTIEGIGGGGGGVPDSAGGGGGGGGAYSKISNLSLVPGSMVPVSVGAGGGTGAIGQDTYFNGAECGAASLCAKGGYPGVGSTGGAGGSADEGVGTVKNSGGRGGGGHIAARGGGGGGAGGPQGSGAAGLNASAASGGNGGGADAGVGGSGGIGTSTGAAGSGGDGAEFDSSHGAGGGGGGGGTEVGAGGGGGGAYGGGGGGTGTGEGGSGARGLIIITYTYTPNEAPTVSLVRPPAGAVSGRSVLLEADASDDEGVSGVMFKDNGSVVGAEDTSAPYSLLWDTTAASDGLHTLVAVARDTAGRLATSTEVAVTVDNTAPAVLLTAPASGTSVAGLVALEAEASDAGGVAGVTFFINGARVGTEDTSAPYAVGWNASSLPSGSYSSYAVARDASGNHATSSTIAFAVDNAAPLLSAISAVPSATGATITWTTDKPASSQVRLGLAASCLPFTPEYDTSPRVTSHSVHLTGLSTCTEYEYQVQSRDALLHAATSNRISFYTAGCTGGGAVVSSGEQIITRASGGTLMQGGAAVTVPASFSAASNSAVFQANTLDAASFFSAAGVPADKTRTSGLVLQLKAFVDATTTISAFAAPIRITLPYTHGDIAGLDESSLRIYRHHGSGWELLSNCAVDPDADTVTCETGEFSEFAIFGSPEASDAESGGASRGGGHGSVRQKEVGYVQGATTTLPRFQFIRTLRYGYVGEDVQMLQVVLNALGFVLSFEGPGAPGFETRFFGQLTRAAVVRLQETYAPDILAPLGLRAGTGIFGSSTRSFINRLLQPR